MLRATAVRLRLQHLLAVLGVAGLAGVFSLPAAAQDGARAAPLHRSEQPGPVVQGTMAAKVANDLSGMACRPATHDATLDCLVVNDESTAAQRVTIGGGRLTPGAMVPLIGDDPPRTAVGSRPIIDTCPSGAGKFGEFDGEGVAFAAASPAGDGAFYVVGSHGCSRNKGEFRPSSFLLARVRTSRNGDLAPVELSWRLSDALRAAPIVGAYFGRSLGPDFQGLNVEGIAAVGDRLLFGLRAPARNGSAYVVRMSVAGLFAPGSGPSSADPKAFPVALGPNAGIRDMAALPDGRLLVLSGPAQEQKDVPYSIALVTLDDVAESGSVQWLARLEDVVVGGERAKAEAITVLGRDGDVLRLLVLFDGLENGGPREYRIPQ